MKKRLLLFLFAMLTTASAWAYDFEVDEIYYGRTSETTMAVTYYDSYNAGYISNYEGDVIIPSSVTYEGTAYSVTEIDDHAFNHCSGLTSVTIPSSATEIGEYAFYGCSSLTSITIPSSVTEIDWSAFMNCFIDMIITYSK